MQTKAGKTSFREVLQGELIRRCRQNPRYSLRAFAKYLDVESSWLSKVLRGKKDPSSRSVEKLGLRLGLSLEEVRTIQTRRNLTGALTAPQYLPLSEDIFEVISDWFHFAILELMKLKDFQTDERWIARKLEISFLEARQAIERLQKVGLLKISEDGSWVDTSGGFTTHNLGVHATSEARRRLQETILKKSLEAVQTLPISKRDHSSIMMATSAAKLEEAKIRIDLFREQLCVFLEDCKERDTVFQLSIGLFPITKS